MSKPRPHRRRHHAPLVTSPRRTPIARVALAALLASPCLATTLALGQDAGTIEAVTVYRGQARVTRSVPLPGSAGLHEVIVTDLPERIVPGSISAASDEADVRSVRFRTRPIGEAIDADDRAELREIDARLQELADVDQSLQNAMSLAQRQLQYLDQLAQFTQRQTGGDVERGALDAEAVAALSGFIFEEQERLTELVLAAQIERRELGQQSNELQVRRREITGSNTRVTAEAVLFVDVRSTDGTLDVSYLVNEATWSPSYNVRAAGDEPVRLEYQASVVQNSGEDWNGVELTLSTATPAMVASAPPLDPLTISAQASPPDPSQSPAQAGQAIGGSGGGGARGDAFGRIRSASDYLDNRVQLLEQQRAAVARRNSNVDRSFQSLKDADEQLNEMSKQMQTLELAANFDLEESDDVAEPVGGTGVAVAYRIDDDVTMPSRNDAQLIRIAQHALPATFETIATPVISEMVFTTAEARNVSGLVLLAGPAASYLDGQFVGNGYVPAVASGEMLDLGFGVDARLRTQRAVVERTERTSGGNRVVTITYRLSIENFGDEAIAILLRDRLPVASDDSVAVDLVETSRPLLDDRAYREGDRKQGILVWPLEVPAGATGADAATVEFTFTMEHDRQRTINLAG